MKMRQWMRTMTGMLLSLTLLCGCAAGLAEEAADTAAATDTAATDTAAAETAEPLLLVTVNGEEIWSNNEEMQKLIDYYTSYYSSYGYDVSDPGLMPYLQAEGMTWAVEDVLYRQKAKELGIEEMTEEQKAQAEARAKESWERAVSSYAQSQGGLTEESTEEETAAARLQALEYIESNFGYTEESFIREFVADTETTMLRENVHHAVLGEITVSDEEVTSHFNELVEEDKNSYENNIPMYEYYTNYMGSNSYYVPEGYRGITHILLNVDSELMNNYTSLQAKLEEQQEAEDAADEEVKDEEADAAGDTAGETVGETEAADEAADEAAAETATAETGDAPAAEETPEEPVTQEMVDAAKQAIMDSVAAQVDEIMAKYKAGTPFADLIAEYGNDPGMTQEPNKTDGYAVHKESILWDPVFTEGAMALEKVGDVSEPVLGSHGVHILHYTRDIPAGAVELTEEIRSELHDELLSEKENTAVSAMKEEWKKEAKIEYTDDGQAILDAVAELEAESVETTEATEEALSDGQ